MSSNSAGTRHLSSAIERLAPSATTLERLADALAVVLGLVAAMLVRDIDARIDYDIGRAALFALIFICVFAVVGWADGLYRNRSRYGSFDEISSLARTTVVTTVVAALIDRVTDPRLVPTSVVVLTGVFGAALMGAIRYGWRLVWEHVHQPRGAEVRRVLVVGAGDAGEQLIRAMRRNPMSKFLPVGLIDDDPRLRRLQIAGVPMLGSRAVLAEAAESLEATAAVIAIPSATGETVRELAELIRGAGLDVLVLPPVTELVGDDVGISDVRPVSEVDLLGRHEVDIDIDAIAGYVTGKRVLVTGAGGSIGSELCRQLRRFAPDRLVMLDRDESGLHGTQLLLHGRALLDDPDVVVADLRDRDRILDVFEETRPHVVFHAAALKHLPLLELHPAEAMKTNVGGTLHVLEAARAVGVERFVNISTDKAASPTSVLGYSKRIGERLTAHAAAEEPGSAYLSVRFGNVLGSKGSVLTGFRRQITGGGPVTVTHPEVTRYFMTVEEAVKLVIQAGAIGESGHVLVLDMGEPVRIDDIARQLIAAASRPVEIVYTGLRAGEKLHEVLFGVDEEPAPAGHPLLTSVRVPPIDPERLRFDLRSDGGHPEPLAVAAQLEAAIHW